MQGQRRIAPPPPISIERINTCASIRLVTDNDGKLAALTQKYKEYAGKPKVSILYDPDENYPTLEPQLLKANSRSIIEKVLGRIFVSDGALLEYMKDNKPDTALKFFTTSYPWTIPGYIISAII